jgi:nitrate reductase alpha subunit
MTLSRRAFLWVVGGGATALAGADRALAMKNLRPVVDVDNPLAAYPDRSWEKVYRDLYRYDSTFKWVCSPNCTHECRLHAFVRNGVVLRSEQMYENQRISDLYGNKSTAAWNPRGCSNGFTFQRRLYGPHRLRYPIIRKGWKAWADAGFPDLDSDGRRAQYLFDRRGEDEFVRASWDDVYGYLARAMVAIARRYSGESGKAKLIAQGATPEMLEHWKGAGTRTMKFRGGMGLLGVIGKYGMYRMSNMMAVLDAFIRKVPHEQAQGGRNWSNYTWHGDQAPGHPFVHGLQASDCDFNDLRNSKLIVQLGKNLVENKRPDSHFFIECMERGATMVTVAPEYSPPASKCDYWIPVRPQSDAALLLGITRIIIEKKLYDAPFVKRFTDFPLLVRKDTLQRLSASDLFPGYQAEDITRGPSMKIHGLTAAQRKELGDWVVRDAKSNAFKPVSRDDVGERLDAKGLDPELEGSWTVKLADGTEVEVATLFTLYKDVHLKDYDLDTVCEITRAPRALVERLAVDLGTIKPAGIHVGEGINHWFHATMVNRASYLPLILTGNIGKPGAGGYTWAGNYKAGLFQGSASTGPGFKIWVGEDPFAPVLDPAAPVKTIPTHIHAYDEEPGYWNYGEKPLIVDTPKAGRKCFTGKTHMPTPTRFMWFTNVNLINNAKWAYEMIKNVNPIVECIVSTDIELNGTVEYSDIALAASSWMETQSPEITGSCSNPFLQIWKGGIPPVYDTRDDVVTMAQAARRLGEEIVRQGADAHLGELMSSYWKFALEGKAEVYIQRLMDASTPLSGYRYRDVMAGKYGEPGMALMMFRTYPRIPFYEQVKDSLPFFTPTGRLQAYNDEPEVIEYGENFIVHREGPEATEFLPNVIVSSNPLIRPQDYGIPHDHMGAGERQVRNVRMPWPEARKTKNPLWEKGYQFYCLTPKSRHFTHSSWGGVDWHLIWSSQFGDPYRADRRAPNAGEHTLHINPQAARDLGIADGDYVYVDANPADRPYIGWKPSDAFYRVSRLMLRVKYNPAYPYNVVMMKHGTWISTDRTVKAHETRPDGLARAAGTNYQSSFRYGSQQSITRGWLMPMHQLDSLFHKSKARMGFIRGFEADNHGINTVPKETLVKITKAEDGGPGGKGVWEPARSGRTPDTEDKTMLAYLSGELTKIQDGE